MIGRKKKQIFAYLKDRVVKKIQGWKHRHLSRAGKEILLKTVAQSMPNYAMSVFLLPLDLCNDLEKMMNAYWWGGNTNQSKGIEWMCWKCLCNRKHNGGLGFRTLHDFNIALLAKQGWRLMTNQNSLMARVIQARYYPHKSFLEAKLGHNPSYLWRSILAAQDLNRRGYRWRIGVGHNVSVWNDPWLPDDTNPFVTTPCPIGLEALTGADLIVEGEHLWNHNFLKGILSDRDFYLILKIPLSIRNTEDTWYWGRDIIGVYKVKSGYQVLSGSPDDVQSSTDTLFWRKF